MPSSSLRSEGQHSGHHFCCGLGLRRLSYFLRNCAALLSLPTIAFFSPVHAGWFVVSCKRMTA